MKNNILSILLFLATIQSAFGQTNNAYVIIENPAQFPNGGMAEFQKYVIKNLKASNFTDTTYRICASFIVSFTIEKDGKASEIQYKRGCSNLVFQRTVIETIEKMPAWIPATTKGQVVRMMFTVPFRM